MEQPSKLRLQDFKPTSKLELRETKILNPRFPVIDAHNHLGEEFGGGWVNRPVDELIEVLDQASVDVLVDMDGGWGEEILERHLDHFKAAAPDRFLHFGGVDWSKWSEHGDRFGDWAAKRLRDQVRRGARGLKIWKVLGLSVRDQEDRLVSVDDRRLDPIWETAAELDIPVLIHVADPTAFFDPLDQYNERWEELNRHPDWHFPPSLFPTFQEIIHQFSNLVSRHPHTIFIGAHVGCYSENLRWVGDLINSTSNLFIDIGARISELGRQPYSARRFLIEHADRILFGTDLAPDVEMYRLHFRFLETDDEYFDYSHDEIPPQGRWRIYGVSLSDGVLEKIYSANAKRVLGME
jgi:predicted TIM-barrel fold metal-dependent hydrolase